MGRDDDGVRLELVDRVAQGRDGIGLDDDAVCRDACGAKHAERLVEPAAGGRAARVVVHDVALARLVDGRDDSHLQVVSLALLLEQVDERLRSGCLVGNHDDMAHAGTSAVSCDREGARIACCAPGTPYSYGEPTTCGISVKLKMGGGELTCHSSVIARHGFDGAMGPFRQLLIML